MPTLEEVKQQVSYLSGGSAFLSKAEIKELPKILWEDEEIKKAVQGFYQNGNGLLVATNKRVIFLNKGLFGGLQVEDFSFDKISSIQYNVGFITGDLTIFASGNKATIKNIEKGSVRDFADYLRANLDKKIESKDVKLDVVGNDDDYISKLERLAVLKEKGVLTDDEFKSEKSKILSSN